MKKIVVLIIAVFLFVSPCFAKTSFKIERVSDIPDGIQVEITQTKNNFKVSVTKTSEDYYSLDFNDAVIMTQDGVIHRLVEPLPFRNYSKDVKFPNRFIFNDTQSYNLAPVENLRFPKNIPIECSSPVLIDFDDARNIIKNNKFVIRFPIMNEKTKEVVMLEFKCVKK